MPLSSQSEVVISKDVIKVFLYLHPITDNIFLFPIKLVTLLVPARHRPVFDGDK